MKFNQPNIGTSINDLETPSLIIDLEAMESNFSVISETYADSTCKMRQHAKNIKCPDILWRQIEIGGTLNGVCAAKVSEAEVMVEGGIRDVLITSEVVGSNKQKRLAYLATISNIAPFLGVLGTVVGIINAFAAIGEMGSAELAVVAPAISEALVATALGISVAIPASIGFNMFQYWVEVLSQKFDRFSDILRNRLENELILEHASSAAIESF